MNVWLRGFTFCNNGADQWTPFLASFCVQCNKKCAFFRPFWRIRETSLHESAGNEWASFLSEWWHQIYCISTENTGCSFFCPNGLIESGQNCRALARQASSLCNNTILPVEELRALDFEMSTESCPVLHMTVSLHLAIFHLWKLHLFHFSKLIAFHWRNNPRKTIVSCLTKQNLSETSLWAVQLVCRGRHRRCATWRCLPCLQNCWYLSQLTFPVMRQLPLVWFFNDVHRQWQNIWRLLNNAVFLSVSAYYLWRNCSDARSTFIQCTAKENRRSSFTSTAVGLSGGNATFTWDLDLALYVLHDVSFLRHVKGITFCTNDLGERNPNSWH